MERDVMARNPIFATYRQGENRVTGSMLAVFERLEVGLLQRILAAALEDSTVELIEYRLQPGDSATSTPDARIRGSFEWLIEVKTTPGGVRERQLREHLEAFRSGVDDQRLLVLTPDAAEPSAVSTVGEPCVWSSFRHLADAIDTVLADPAVVVGEHAVFLLRELQALFVEDGLLDPGADVVVVPARSAYPEYLKHSAYVCQPKRTFKPGLTHLAFYVERTIKELVPAIRYVEDEVVFSEEEAARRDAVGEPLQREMASLVRALLQSGPRTAGESFKVFLLTAPDDGGTVRLPAAVPHTGKGAWVQNQRYTSVVALTAPGVRSTDDLAS
ncbi:MAG: hypothetical protein ACRD0U_18535 [Acidimicrobiales bacterium]